ncbi:hypothetical protein [Blastopirellula marina]|uniref:Uncharacterized protein n=1 Tax=Blastopirellula marina DSM 3645 TaxID=314230 RepID=A3ZP28_9BACT|nr:hypothetical protein [Blastopirellula marina]EAQ81502.1 hypothetical protein DSM3645_28012 [Blastopirellula marina DSM 3645]
MTETFIELTEDEFDQRFPLVSNHLNSHAGWAIGDGPGCLFETYGEELAFVRGQDVRFVWTLIDGDDGDMYLVGGFHHVNRIGYLISSKPIPKGACIQVHLPMPTVENEP